MADRPLLGHTISKCEGARKIDRSAIADLSTDDAWEKIKTAVRARDIDDVKEAL